MKVMFDMGHPADVHFFKHTMRHMEDAGHEIMVVARAREITLNLLSIYGFAFEKLEKYDGLMNRALGMLINDYKMLKIAKGFRPDLFVSYGSPYSAQVSAILGKPHISFGDTEIKRYTIYHLVLRLTFEPFTDVSCTPSCFTSKINPKKHVKYKGYKELAYLHPNYFKPDPSILEYLGLCKDDKFIILRFSSFDAIHDIRVKGFQFKTTTELLNFVKKLENYGHVFITSELKHSKDFEKYTLSIPPEKMHDLLSFATMYIGEGATMASEAGVLGVPSIFVYSYAHRLGNFDDLQKCGLVYSFLNKDGALDKTFELLERNDLRKEWQKKRRKLLNEKIDVTKFMIWFIENYPESFQIMQENPEYQERFK